MRELTIVLDDIQKKYIKKKHEIRIDFVSVLLDNNMVVPLYYYSYKQQCFKYYNYCVMDSDKLKEIDRDILYLLIKEVEEITNAKTIGLSYSNNIHTHPVGSKYFSLADMTDGMLRNDFVLHENKDFCGVNMLYSFDGDFYETLLRRRESGEYKYDKITKTTTIDFNPHDAVNETDFVEKNTQR